MTDETKGWLLGFLGVAAFSLTLPMTRLAVADLSPGFITFGRGAVAALIAALILILARDRLPNRATLRTLAIAAIGVVFGFPFLMSWAMQHVPASHGAVVLAILPLATAIFGALLDAERPSAGFWIVAILGSALVAAFVLREGDLTVHWADLALVGSVFAAAHGYAAGARATRVIGGWRTICWMLVIAAPVLFVALAWEVTLSWPTASPTAWAAFGYTALFSQLIGFFAWYRGLALGGTARIGQIQLLQVFLTIAASALILSEPITLGTLGFAALVALTVWIGRRMPILRPARV